MYVALEPGPVDEPVRQVSWLAWAAMVGRMPYACMARPDDRARGQRQVDARAGPRSPDRGRTAGSSARAPTSTQIRRAHAAEDARSATSGMSPIDADVGI